jgi:hypothetical protein
LEVDGNVKAGMFLGDGSGLKGIKTSQWADVAGGISYGGNVGIGNSSPSEKLEVNGNIKAGKFLGDGSGLTGIKTSQWADVAGGISYKAGNVGIGTDIPGGKLDVMGDIRAGNSDIYFTKVDHNHTGFGNTSGYAAIENAADYGALMILGRSGAQKGRYVRLWDYLQVNGGLDITGSVGIGTTDMKRSLHVEGSEIHSGSSGDGFSFANRSTGSFVESPGRGERWVWYCVSPPPFIGREAKLGGQQVVSGQLVDIHLPEIFITRPGIARLWSGRDLMTIDTNGNVNAASFTPPSDARLKTNIIPITDVLNKLEKIRGVSFTWNELDPYGRAEGGRDIGLIAQEVEEVFPELVTTWGDEGYRGVDYNRFTGVLLEAIKELKSENEAFKGKIKALETAVSKNGNI